MVGLLRGETILTACLAILTKIQSVSDTCTNKDVDIAISDSE